MGYPDFQSQVNILKERHSANPLDRVKAVITADELAQLVKSAAAVNVSDAVYEYVTKLAQATRQKETVQLGVSPRGALAVCRMAKAYAFLKGRDYVVPEDVAAVFPDVCTHRLMLNSKARMMETDARQVIDEIIKSVPMPSVREGKL